MSDFNSPRNNESLSTGDVKTMFFFYSSCTHYCVLSFVSASFVGFKQRGKQLAWLCSGLSQQQYYLKKSAKPDIFFFARLALVTSWNRLQAKKKNKTTQKPTMLLLNRLSTMASECILTLSRLVYHYVLVNHPLFSIKDIIFHFAPTRNLITNRSLG